MGMGFYVIANVTDQDGGEDALVVTTLIPTIEEAREIGNKLTISFKRIMIVQAVEGLGDGKMI